MNELQLTDNLFNQPFDATNLDGKPVTAYFISRVADRDHTWAMSVPPTGAGRWMCTIHRQLFKVAGQCPVCAGVNSDNTNSIPLIPPAQVVNIAEKVE